MIVDGPVRQSIDNVYYRMLFFPIAIIQWALLVLFYGVFFGFFIGIPLGITFFIVHFITWEKEEMKMSLELIYIPFYLSIKWWYDYFTKGEIGTYW